MPDLRQLTLWARQLLTRETAEQLQQIYRLDAESGARLQVPKGHLLEQCAGIKETRARIEKLLEDETDAGLSRAEAIQKLIRETAFTHLNRFVAFKLMEARGLIASPIARGHNANGFIKWAVSRPDQQDLYERGDMPKDALGEGPRDRAYRNFLLWQSAELSREIRVLFDPDNLPSTLFPRPAALKELIEALNSEERKGDWSAGNEETIGWVYQYFTANEKAAAFSRVFNDKKKFEKSDIPAATQIFTPRWIVRFLVENSLGRLWLSMHPDSQLVERLTYLVGLPADASTAPMKLVREIQLLDPATGTMHFGLVALELLAEMYREEITNAGRPGWPEVPSVTRNDDIPAAILANNLFGIDIDLRAVQLAALALYLKAKGLNKSTAITESNLACADVAIFRGEHLAQVTKELDLPSGITRTLFQQLRDSLEEASMMGSLVRLENHFGNLQTEQLRQAINAYVEKRRAAGFDESYFAQETSKGLRLLNVLERRYDVVFTNPPYISNGNMNAVMSAFMKRNYKKSKGDLYSGFIERCAELLQPEGRMAMITQQSFMFTFTFDSLRQLLLGATKIESIVHLGPRVFEEVSGEKVNTAAFIFCREESEMQRRNAIGVYFRLVKEANPGAKRAGFEETLYRHRNAEVDSRVYEYRQRDFASIPGGPWVYWADRRTREVFKELPQLGNTFELDMGLKTSANPRFVRFWWEVGKSRIGHAKSRSEAAALADKNWFWYAKGDKGVGFARLRNVVNWHKDGAEIKASLLQKYPYLKGKVEWCTHNEDLYFRPCITWSPVSSNGFKARLVPEGAITSNAAYGIFVDADRSRALYAYLTSLPARYLVRILCSTINHNKGDLARLPVPLKLLNDPAFLRIADRKLELYKEQDSGDETSAEFREPSASEVNPAIEVDQEIDTRVHRELALTQDPDFMREFLSLALEADDGGETEEPDDADDVNSEEEILLLGDHFDGEKWISYAVGIALGRFAITGLEHFTDRHGFLVLQRDHPGDLAQRTLDILVTRLSETQAGQIVRAVAGDKGNLRDALADYLIGSFFKNHLKRYSKRPIYWLLQSPKQRYSVYLFHEKSTDQTLASLQGTSYLGGRIFQLKKQIENARRQEAESEGREKAQWRKSAEELDEELTDLEDFDHAISATNNESIIDGSGRHATVSWSPEFDDGVVLNAAPLYRLTPAWKRVDANLDLKKVWDAMKAGKYPWAKTAMRYWPRETLKACKDNKSYRIAHGLE